MKKSGVVLFSGGLDSILASKVLQAQGIHVIALRFVTPFFGYHLLKDPDKEKKRVKELYGIDLEIQDISSAYLKMLPDPSHGYGKYLNPCLDCKILMVKEAVRRLEDLDAAFIATGEVIGQRPMSQRRDTLRLIERESGAQGILLRPLSALCLPPTRPELEGIVDRSRLLRLSGRGRKEQIRLAEDFGIRDYPTPAGGCVLADPILSRRFKTILERYPDAGINAFLLAQTGRHFFLDDGSWLVIGRNERENKVIWALRQKGDIIIEAENAPGPTGLLRYAPDPKSVRQEVKGRFLRYVKKGSKQVQLSIVTA